MVPIPYENPSACEASGRKQDSDEEPGVIVIELDDSFARWTSLRYYKAYIQNIGAVRI